MQDSGSHEYRADYNALRAPVGCDLAELKRCYWREVRRLHPDRNPELAEDASAQASLRHLTVAYRRLLEYHKVHDRLPGSRQHADRPRHQQAEVAADTPPHAGGKSGTWLMIAAAIAGAAVWMVWPGDPDADSSVNWSPAPALPETTASVAPEPSSMTTASPAPTDLAYGTEAGSDRGIRIGDTKAAVRGILGRPILRSGDAWEYGPSHVRFEHGRVVDWYNSPLKPLRVDESSRAVNSAAYHGGPAGGR